MITLALAVMGGILIAVTTGLFGREKTPGKKSQIGLVALAIIVALVGLLDMNGAAAIGLYLTLFGGVAWVVSAAWQLSLSKRQTTHHEEPAAL